MITEAGLHASALRHIDSEESPALVLGADVDGLAVIHLQRTTDIYLLALLAQCLKSNRRTGARNEMSALGVEVHLQLLLQLLVKPRLGTADNVLLQIVAQRVGALIDRYDTTIDGAILTEEILCHLTVVELIAILAGIEMLGDAEVQHPPRIGTQLVVTRIE